jgi:hypothetical protein
MADKSLSQWCSESSVKDSTIRQRIYAYKWDVEKSLTAKARKRG